MRSRQTILAYMMAAALIPGGCAPQAVEADPDVLTIGIVAGPDGPTTGRADHYRIGKRTIPIGDEEALRQAIATAQAQRTGRSEANEPLRMRIVAESDVPWETVAPLVRAATGAGIRNIELVTAARQPPPTPPDPVDPDDEPEPGLPVEPITIRIKTGEVKTEAVYEVTGDPGVLRSRRELREHLLRRKEVLGTICPVVIVPAPEVSHRFVLAAFDAAKDAGFRRIALAQKRRPEPVGKAPASKTPSIGARPPGPTTRPRASTQPVRPAGASTSSR